MKLQIAQITRALYLLGLRPCSQCGKVSRRSDPKALLQRGDLDWYRCLPEWCSQHGVHLLTKQMEEVECNIVRWLVREHNAKIVTRPDKLLLAPGETAMIARCAECRRAGKIGNRHCPYCDDGNRWV